jgi:hypothetical protein
LVHDLGWRPLNEDQFIAVKHGRPLTPISDAWLAGDIKVASSS